MDDALVTRRQICHVPWSVDHRSSPTAVSNRRDVEHAPLRIEHDSSYTVARLQQQLFGRCRGGVQIGQRLSCVNPPDTRESVVVCAEATTYVHTLQDIE